MKKEEMLKNLLLESKIFDVTIFGDGATITNVLLKNTFSLSPNTSFALLEIVDCTDKMAKGGKKDVRYLSDFVRPIVKWLEATDLIMFDGASNIQLDICWVHKHNECQMGGELISLLRFLHLKDGLRSTINSKEFLDLNNFKEECCVLNNNNFWMYLFKLYFFILQTDRMLLKWLPDCKKKATELLRDTSFGQVMINCDADIVWGSNKEEIFVNKDDNDEESGDDDDLELESDDEEDSNAYEEMEFNFNHPMQVSLCASLIVNYLHLLISLLVLVTKVTLICPSTREMD